MSTSSFTVKIALGMALLGAAIGISLGPVGIVFFSVMLGFVGYGIGEITSLRGDRLDTAFKTNPPEEFPAPSLPPANEPPVVFNGHNNKTEQKMDVYVKMLQETATKPEVKAEVAKPKKPRKAPVKKTPVPAVKKPSTKKKK